MSPSMRFGEHPKIQLNLARLKKAGENFEVDINPEFALAFKEGKTVDIKDVIMAQKIFTDAKKGLVASDNQMKNVFGTSDPLEVAKIILKDGEIQITEEHRERFREEKRKRIVEQIRRNGIDPRTGIPHPMTRIEAAIEEAKVKIDEFKPEEKQVQEILRKLQPILPIRFETRDIEVYIDGKYASRSKLAIKTYGKISKEEWQSDGSWKFVITIPAGMQEEFFDRLNALTKGSAHTKMVGTKIDKE